MLSNQRGNLDVILHIRTLVNISQLPSSNEQSNSAKPMQLHESTTLNSSATLYLEQRLIDSSEKRKPKKKPRQMHRSSLVLTE